MDLPGERALPDPIDVGRAQFGTAKKGFDQAEVRSYLTDVAKGLGDYRELVKDLERRIGDLEAEVAQAYALADHAPSPDELTELLGAEAARVLNAAREAAAQREAEVETLLEEHRHRLAAESAAARREAEQLLDTARSEAERIRQGRLAEVESELAALRSEVDHEVAERRRVAEDEVRILVAEGEQARAEAKAMGRAMVAEAQVVRERILGDLARRRQAGRRELEQIRAGRDRLLAAFSVAGDELGAVIDELTVSLPEARAAAQRAGVVVDVEEIGAAEIDRELEAARLVGHPLVQIDEAAPEADDDETTAAEPDPVVSTDVAAARGPGDESVAPDSAGAQDGAEGPGDNVVLAELGARRSRLTRVGRIAQQLPTGEIPVLRGVHDYESVRVIGEGADDPAGVVEVVVDDDGVAMVPGGEEEPETADGATADRDADDGSDVADEAGNDDIVEEGEVGAADDRDADEETMTDGVMESDALAASEVADEIEQAGVDEAPETDETEEVAASDEGTDETVDSDATPSDTDEGILTEAVAEAEEAETAESDEVDLLETTDADEAEPQPDGPLFDLTDGPAATGTPAAGDAEPASDDAIDDLFAQVRAAVSSAPSDNGETTPEAAPASVATVDRPDNASVVAARDEALGPVEDAVARALKRTLTDEQNELLEAISAHGADMALDDLLGRDEHVRRYGAAVHDDLEAAFAAGARSVTDAPTPPVLTAAERAVEAEVVDRVREAVAEALAAGADGADHLRTATREIKRNRLPAAAEHVVMVAYNAGIEVALGDRCRRWVRDQRRDCGIECEANERQGPVSPGHIFDGGVAHPPMFPGCRCILVEAPQ